MTTKRKIGNGTSRPYFVGSYYFFCTYDDYEGKDTDYVVLVDEPIMFKDELNIRMEGKDVFYYRRMTPSEFVEKTLTQDPMCAGKFLNGELCKDIGFTLDDLMTLKEKFDNIDTRHSYEKVIFDAYMVNGDFTLTDEQRLSAYDTYKKNKNKK